MQSLVLISIAPLFLAIGILIARDRLPRMPLTWATSIILGLLLVGLMSFLTEVSQGAVQSSIDWVPALGLSLSFYLDGLSLLFAIIIVGIGAVVALYAGYYFDEIKELTRFYGLLLAFMSAMLGLVLAGNVLTLFIAWELTSIISFLLISFYGETSADARKGALRALIVTGGGGLALLVGLALLGTAGGSMEFSQLLINNTLRENPWYTAITILIFMGCFSKSAQWPLHFWLPGAMSAPTPASAYLHSATMVKAGIYLLLRLQPALGDTPLWQYGLMGFGLITMLVGALLALRQHDLKAALAYSTVSQLGALVALIGLPEGAGIEAALIGIVAHSLYKAALFLTVGAIDHAAGTRDLTKLGSLGKSLPGWAVVALLAGISMAGLPPLLGFVAKESLLEAMLEMPVALFIVVSSAALTVAMAIILVWDVFMGDRREHGHAIHEPARAMLVGPGLLVGGALLAGVQLETWITPLIQPALTKEIHLALFHGFNEPFFLSLVAISAGLGIFATRNWWRALALPTLPTGLQVYSSVIGGVEKLGDLTLRSQNGKLRYYLVVILGAVTVLQMTAGLSHISSESVQFMWDGETDVLKGLLLLVALGTMLASIIIRRHFMAALLLGVGGYSVGGLFLLEPAPDVALVQFMVETLGTVLLIIMLTKISEPEREAAMDNLWRQSRFGIGRDIVLAVLIGSGVGLFALAAVNNRAALPETIASWHLENALPLLDFPDVVGAIVTDFRGMDTIIEITVFSVAALGVLMMFSSPPDGAEWPDRFRKLSQGLRWNARQNRVEPDKVLHVKEVPHEELEPEELFESRFSTPLTRTIANLVLPLTLLVALSHLLYGGEGPGDGFTAGVISGLGIALWYIVFGHEESKRRLGWLYPRYLIGAGLTLVIANAILPMLFGMPFLAHISFNEIHLPANLHLSTTLFYETGIFLTVLGSTSTIMETISYPKEVEPL